MKKLKKIYLALSSILFFIIFFELFNLIFTDLNPKLLKNSLYGQESDLGVFQVSNDTNRLYELKPNAKVVGKETNPLEIKYSQHNITINSLGFRDIERNKTKNRGVYRIVILGGSNTMGATVADSDTYPIKLQELLNEKYPGKFEVWNAGVYAYVMSQKVAYANNIIKELDPDLLIFHNYNKGRRAFLINEEFSDFFKKNPELYLENIPLLISNNSLLEKIHYKLVSSFESYRFVIININNVIIKKNIKDMDCLEKKHWGWWCYNNISPFIKEKFKFYGEKVNVRETKKFIEKQKDVKIIIFDSTKQKYCSENYIKEYDNVSYFSFCDNNKP